MSAKFQLDMLFRISKLANYLQRDLSVFCVSSVLLKQFVFKISKLSFIKYDMLEKLGKKSGAACVIHAKSCHWLHWPSWGRYAHVQLDLPTP